MAKTQFIDGNQSQGIQGTVVTAQFLNNLNNQRHDGLDEDGHGALDYAVTGGSGNTYTLTLNPPLPAYIAGLPVYFRASRDNTGAATLNINGLGARTIRRINQNLAAGQIKNGQLYMVMYDGTYFQLVSMPADNITLADAVSVPSANKVAKYNERGVLPGAELNMTDLASATSNSSSTLLDLGNLSIGDALFVQAHLTTGGEGVDPTLIALSVMRNSVSTAFVYFGHNLPAMHQYTMCRGADGHFTLSGVCRVHYPGSLILMTSASSSQSGIVYTNNQLSAFFLRKY